MNTWKTEMFDKILPKIKQSIVAALDAMENGSAEDKVLIRALIRAFSKSLC